MIEVKRLRNNKEEVLKALEKRPNFEEIARNVEYVISQDEIRRINQAKLDDIIHEQKVLSGQIKDAYKSKDIPTAESLKLKAEDLKTQSKVFKQMKISAEENVKTYLCRIPNIPNEAVHAGENEDDNEIIRDWYNNFKNHHNKPHYEIAKELGYIDFEAGAKITGSGFPVYIGQGARIQRALINFFLDEAYKAGYQEVMVPHLVNQESVFGTGQYPDKDGQMYHTEKDNLYLIPTAEVPITNMSRDTIYEASELPIKRVGYTPCFRREAGSYGKDVKGLNRLHQFDKVEIVRIEHPDNSYKVLEEMVEYIESLLRKLKLTYRVVRLCGKDLTFTSALTYDIEVWSLAQNRWLEVSSISNFETYQANRMNIKVRNEDGTKQLAHTLNGSAIAIPRIMAALMEQYYDGKAMYAPDCTHKYLGMAYTYH